MLRIKRIQMFPIKIIFVYLLLTVALYAFGPIDYQTLHPFLLYPYLLISFILLYIGYNFGNIAATKKLHRRPLKKGICDISLRSYTFMLLVSILLLHLTLYARTGSFFFNFSSFQDLGGNYLKRYELVTTRGRSYIEWLRIILTPITLAYFPIGIINWKRLSWVRRFLLVYLIIGNVMGDLVTGTNKGFADSIIFLGVYLVLTLIYSGRELTISVKLKYFRSKIRGLGRNLILLGILFLVMFTLNISSRLQKNSSTLYDTYTYITSYCTQGYKALDYTFDQPFESTFGFGSSMYILRSTLDWFKTDYFEKRTYLQKNEDRYGWNQRIRWSSIYVWIGNDVSIYGVLVVFIFIGYFFGKVWAEATIQKDIPAIVLSALMVQLCLYIPANNQIVQTAEGLAGVLFFILWRLLLRMRQPIERKGQFY